MKEQSKEDTEYFKVVNQSGYNYLLGYCDRCRNNRMEYIYNNNIEILK